MHCAHRFENWQMVSNCLCICHVQILQKAFCWLIVAHLFHTEGAGLSLYAGYRYSEKLAGVAALSGYLPHFQTFQQSLHANNAKTPAILMHGDADGVVKIKFGMDVVCNSSLSLCWCTRTQFVFLSLCLCYLPLSKLFSRFSAKGSCGDRLPRILVGVQTFSIHNLSTPSGW